MSTLQHALTRGIGLVFQLEEGELLTEPVPSRDSRRAIQAYQATEGGSGLLGRLTAEAGRLAQAARNPPDLPHPRRVDTRSAAQRYNGGSGRHVSARFEIGCPPSP